MTPPREPRRLHEVTPPDAVKLWEQLMFQYPQASYSVRNGFFYGSLRESDPVLRASSLQRLIAGLTERG